MTEESEVTLNFDFEKLFFNMHEAKAGDCECANCKYMKYNTLENIYRYGQRADTISDVWKGLNGLDDNILKSKHNNKRGCGKC